MGRNLMWLQSEQLMRMELS
uniref:Uncharacterized protein n=1 Tax=Arundo donax TaxID=35708 RepID=A0A0A9F8H2_ARUDO